MIQISADTKRPPIDAEQTMSILQNQTDSYGVFFNLDRILEYECDYVRKARVCQRKLVQATKRTYITLTKGQEFARVLVDMGLIDKRRVTNRNDSLSFDKKMRESIIEDTSLNEDVRQLTKLFDYGAKNQYMSSYLKQYKNLPLCNGETAEGDRMVKGNPMWNVLSTSRISAEQPSIQNIKRDIQDIITAPKGMTLIRSDSSQIEPRIVYSWSIPDPIIQDCIRFYDDAYMGLLCYVYLPDEALTNWDANKYCKEISEEMRAKRQSLKRLTNAANYGSKLADVEPNLRSRYEARLVNHPLRLKRTRDVEEAINHGQETFYGYFGTPVTPDSTQKHTKGSESWPAHLLHCAINNPVQTTASELMMFSVNNALDILRKFPNTHIGYYKHDESMFYVPEDIAEDVAPLIQDGMSYQVEGWLPIGSDLLIGRKEGNKEVKPLICNI